jgi:hypothetical protein
MFTDLYLMLCMNMPKDLEIITHHFLCITGIYYALTSTHMTQLADTIIIYESTGFMFNMHHLLVYFNFSPSHWLYLSNGATFVVAFTYFRMYLGSALAIHFMHDEKVESRVFVLIATLFHAMSVYWYYLIISEMVGILYPLIVSYSVSISYHT